MYKMEWRKNSHYKHRNEHVSRNSTKKSEWNNVALQWNHFFPLWIYKLSMFCFSFHIYVSDYVHLCYAAGFYLSHFTFRLFIKFCSFSCCCRIFIFFYFQSNVGKSVWHEKLHLNKRWNGMTCGKIINRNVETKPKDLTENCVN